VIDEVLHKCEPIIQRYILHKKEITAEQRDRVAQDMRIKIWRATEKNQPKDIDDFIAHKINFRLLLNHSCLNVITSDSTRSRNIVDISDPMIESECVTDPDIDIMLEMHSLMECLDEKEKFFVEYMLVTCNIGDNFERLDRQFGYSCTSKNASKRIFCKIMKKMKDFSQKMID